MTDPKKKVGNPSLIKYNIEDDEIKKIKYKIEKHDFGNIFKKPLKMIVKFIKRNINLQIKEEVNLIAAGIVIGTVGLSVGSGLITPRPAPV